MPGWKRNKPSRAFTLLEVMVAVAVLAIALTAIFRLQGQSASMCSRAKFETTAPLLANWKMAQFMTANEGDLSSGSGDFGDDYPEYAWKCEVDEVSSVVLQDSSKRLRKISLTVSWGDNTYNYQIRAYRLVTW